MSGKSNNAQTGQPPAHDPGKRRSGASASKQGWKLFSEDVRRGRFFALVGLASLIAASTSFATSPEYIVDSVTVEGSKVLTAEQANEIAGVTGQNIFAVDASAVRARFSEKSALLKNVSVSTHLPNQVVIRVQERKPATVWVSGDGTPMLASDDHIVVGMADTLDGYVTIFDRGPSTDTLKIGAPLPVHKADASDTAQQIYLNFEQATGLPLRQLEWAPDNGVTAITSDGRRIEFGSGENLDKKLKIVQALVQQPSVAGGSWGTLDVRSTERPSVKRNPK